MCIDDLDLQRVDPINRVTSCSMGQLAIVSVFIFMRNGIHGLYCFQELSVQRYVVYFHAKRDPWIILFSGIKRTKICFNYFGL